MGNFLFTVVDPNVELDYYGHHTHTQFIMLDKYLKIRSPIVPKNRIDGLTDNVGEYLVIEIDDKQIYIDDSVDFAVIDKVDSISTNIVDDTATIIINDVKLVIVCDDRYMLSKYVGAINKYCKELQ